MMGARGAGAHRLHHDGGYAMKTRLALLALAGASLCAAQASAQDGARVVVEAGVEYDSNVAIEEADLDAREGDGAAVFALDADYWLVEDRLRVGYNFDQRAYFSLKDFNQQIHRPSIGLRHRSGPLRFGLDYTYAHVRRGGDALFDLHTLTPSVAGRLDGGGQWRAYYSYAERTFDRSPSRDAEVQRLGGSFRQALGGRRSLTFTGRLETEDAIDPALDFDGYLLGVAFRAPFPVAGRRGEFELGSTFRRRDYDNITPSIGERREEDRLTLSAAATLPLAQRLGLRGEYRYTDRDSNFAVADYTENRVSLRLVYTYN